MRKRNVTHVADTIFWWVIYSIPLLVFISATISYVLVCGNMDGTVTIGSISWFPEEMMQEVFESSGTGSFESMFDIVIFDNIVDFCTLGINSLAYFFEHIEFMDIPLFDAFAQIWDLILPGSNEYVRNALCGTFTWFISAHILHIMVDFIVFIPRLCHKWLGKAYQDD